LPEIGLDGTATFNVFQRRPALIAAHVARFR
jgi:hypothetical protein